MTDQNLTTIEINGVKLEVDLRHARRIEQIKVGSRVKVLTKEYSGYKVQHGIVIGFEPFEQLPTIIIAALELSYNDAKINFIYYNKESKDTEVVISIDNDEAAIDKEHILKTLDRAMQVKQSELTELENRRFYFLSKFNSYWEPLTKEVAAIA